ncbi:MAG: hypothetical protein IT383_09985 [Deltaproteobacteria bacterium]|nr:hypothetical protein [Deltaproteobacteria bacterium]
MMRAASAAVVSTLAAGCYDITIPDGARVQCSVETECPPAYKCREEIKLCVPEDSADQEVPTALDVVVSPPAVGVGVELTVSFDTSEALLLPPEVTLVLDGDATRTLVVAARDDDAGAAGTGFVARTVAVGDESEGPHALRALLVDLAGNVATNLDLQAATFDFTPPGIAELTVSPAVGSEGTVVSAVIRTSEALDDDITSVTVIDGRSFTLEPAGADPLTRSFTLAAAAGQDAEGAALLAVTLSDLAGNKTVRTVDDALAFDFTAPAVEGGVVVPRPIVRAGQVALLAFRTTEPVAAVEVELVPSVGDGPALPMTLEANSGRDLSFRREIDPGDADGSYTARVVTLVDHAGIAAEPATITDATLVVDQRAPSFLGEPTSSPEVASLVPGRDTITVAFVVDEPAEAAVRLGDQEVPCVATPVPGTNALSFACERGVTAADAEGIRGVTITVVDGAENSAFATAPSVTLDFSAPTLMIGVVPDREARAGEVISVTAVAEEALDPTSVSFDGGGLGFSAPSVAGRTLSSFFAVPAGLEGSFLVSVAAADLGGNSSSTVQQNVSIDGVAPSLSSFSLSSPRIAPDEIFTLTLLPSEELAGAPTVSFANGDVDGQGDAIVHAMSLVAGPLVDGSWSFSGIGPASGLNQFYTITVVMQDVAGNPGADNPAVIVVDNAPPDLSGFDIAPAFARNGDTVRVVVSADETLAGPPSLVARNGANTFTLVPQSLAPGAISYVFTMAVGAGTAQGTWTFDGFTLTDEANNARAIASSPTRSFSVDSRAPVLSGVSISPTVARVGTVVTLSANVDEPAASAFATVDGAPMTLVSALPASALTFTYQADGSEPEGVLGVTLSVADAAGNSAVAGGDVEMDFSAPVLLSTGVTPAVAKAASTISYTVSADELLAAPPVLTISGGALPFVHQSGTAYVYAYTVIGSTLPGPRTVDIAMEDLAGNTSSAAGVGFTIDTSTPSITGITATPPFASLAAGFNVVTVGFTLSEDVGAGLIVTVGVRGATCTNSGLDYSCTAAVELADGAGAKSVVVQATDLAGNVGVGTSSVVYDFTAPTLLSSSAVPPAARAGDVVTLNLTPSEPLLGGAAPTVVVTGPSATSFSHVSSTQYSYRYTVTGGEVSGARTVSTTLTDRAGNAAVVAPTGFALDVDTPEITTFTLGARSRLSTVAGYDQTTISAVVSDEPAGSVPTVVVRAGASALACTTVGDTTTCPYTASGSEPSAHSIIVTATDAAGNLASQSRTLEFDFTPPALVGPVSLSISPPTPALILSPSAARAGADVRIGLTLSEHVATPTVRTTGGTPLAFSVLAETNPTFLFQHVVAGSPVPPQGAQTVRLTAVDDVGNTLVTDLSLPGSGFVVDTVAPAAPDVSTLDRTVFERVPWGDTTGANRFRVTGSAGAVESNATVIAWSGSEIASASELGRAAALGTGAFTLTLGDADRPQVHITSVDGAGNPSDAVAGGAVQATKVRDITWVAALSGKMPGSTFENPHVFERRLQLEPLRAQADSAEPSSSELAQLASVNGAGVQTTGAPSWEEVSSAVPIGGRADMAYDPEAECVWLPSGPTTMMRFDGYHWQDVEVPDPEGDGNPDVYQSLGFVFDEGYGNSVLFTQSGETWLWNGTSWQIANAGDSSGVTAPRPRFNFAMTYDDNEGAVVLFGGSDDTISMATCEDDGACLNDLWAWDGNDWYLLSDGTEPNAPSIRTGPAMGFDPASGGLIVFGGRSDAGTFGDTYYWDGIWWLLSATSTPRANARMLHDPFLDGLVMIGGEDGGGSFLTTQEFYDGSDWTSAAPADPELDGNPVARSTFGIVYDRTRDAWWLFGGECAGYCQDTWRGDGSSWRRLGPPELSAAQRSGVGLSYERARGTLLLFGGIATFSMQSELRIFDGAAWPPRTQTLLSGTALPSARAEVAMSWDEGSARTIMFGGRVASSGSNCDGGATNGLCDATYILNSAVTPATWVGPLLPATRPSKRRGASMVYDASRDRSVLFGGNTTFGGTPSAQIWDWDTTSSTTGTWTQRCTGGSPCAGTAPSARAYHAMAYDRIRGVSVLWGGSVADANVYEFNGAGAGTWTRIIPSDPEGDGSPVSRQGARMVYDEQRRKMLLFGAADFDAAPCDVVPRPASCGDTWEWNGTSWRALVATASPAGDLRPSARTGHEMAYHLQRGETVMVGGTGVGTLETWRLVGGGNTRPGHVTHVDFRTAQAGGALPRDVAVLWTVGATAAGVNGARLSAMRNDAPALLASNVASSASPASLTATISSSTWDLFDSQRIMSFWVEPSATSGSSSTPGRITSDHVQVTVRYRLP